jgi:TonB family protein
MSIAEVPAERAAALRPVVPEISQDRSVQPLAKEPIEISGHAPEPEHRIGTERRKRNSWAVALAGTAVLLLAYWLVPLVRLPQLSVAPAPMPQAPLLPAAEKPAAPAAVVPVKAAAQPARLALQTLHGVTATAVAGQPVTKRTASAAAERANAAAVLNSAPLPQIEEAPRSGFVYPVTPNPNLVGKVVLKAVVGSDGTVKQVEVLSGDRALALAAVRAVRQWRYAPPQVDGRTVEAETHVTISFLGDDAVSIILPSER